MISLLLHDYHRWPRRFPWRWVPVVLLLGLLGCRAETSIEPWHPSASVEILTWSYDSQIPWISPWDNHGVFEIAWDLRESHGPVHLFLSLHREAHDGGPAIVLYDARCSEWSSSCELLDSQVYQFFPDNTLWWIDDWGDRRWLADLTGWLTWSGMTLYLRAEVRDEHTGHHHVTWQPVRWE